MKLRAEETQETVRLNSAVPLHYQIMKLRDKETQEH